MNTLRNLVNSNKGFVTFSLVLFFLFAGVAKCLAFELPANTAKATKEYSKQLFSAEDDIDASISASFQLLDDDADDADFIFYPNYNAPKFLVTTAGTKQTVYAAVALAQGYTLPLYDLYCNWKFDLFKL